MLGGIVVGKLELRYLTEKILSCDSFLLSKNNKIPGNYIPN